MPQQTEVLVQQGAIKPSTNNLLNSIDEAIEHFEDSETQIILKKYGFDINSLIDDLNDSKDCVSKLTKGQQRSRKALETYIHSKRSLGWMSEDVEAIINRCREEITASIEVGSSHNSKLESFAFELRTNLSKDPNKHIQVIQELRIDKQKEINAENEPSDKAILQEKYDFLLRRIDDNHEK